MKTAFPIFCIVFLSIITFWGENFLSPDTYSIYGDTVFSLRQSYINTYLYPWDSWGAFGLGYPSLFPPYLPSYFLVYLWSILDLPLWVANRLWHILPDIFIGLGALYLYKSLFSSKYSWICGTICSIFIMLVPEKFVIPVYELGFAGTMFALGSLIRGLFAKEITNYQRCRLIVVFSLGIMLAIHGLRYLYISLILMGLIVILTIRFFREERQQRGVRILKFINTCLLLTFLLNLFWIIPLCLLLSQGKQSIVPAAGTIESRETLTKEHQKMTNPLYILRASTGGEGLGRPPYYYFSHPFVLPFSFLIPLYCFLPLLIKNINKKIKLLIFTVVLLTSYSVSFCIFPFINLFLRKYIPTFWVMGNPQYWAYYIAVCYGLLIAAITEHFLNLIDVRGELRRVRFTPGVLKSILISSTFIVVIIFGGGVILDKPIVSGFYTPFFLYGNKLPYVRIPKEYDEVAKYLSDKSRTGNRLWYIDTGGYKIYTWAYKGHMPEIMFFKSPIAAVGRPLSHATPMIDLLSDSVNFKKHSREASLRLALFFGDILNIRYIFLHKDYLNKFDIELNNYIRKNIIEDNNFRIIMDNDKFTLYENKNISFTPLYTAQNYILVAGDLDTLPFFVDTVSNNIEKPLFILSKQLEGKGLDLQTALINRIILKDNQWHDLVIEMIGQRIRGVDKDIRLKIKNPGVYEIYFGAPNIDDVKETPTIDIKLDGRKIANLEAQTEASTKYIKIAETRIKRKGRHTIRCNKASVYKDTILQKEVELVLVNKQERQNIEKEVQQKINISDIQPYYIFEKERGEFWTE